jgi:formiminotetrahydrofolate cyclodeaminase
MEIKRFLEKLSSATPTPGGGSASALAGALSAALVSMTAGLSLTKGELKPKEVREIRKKAQRIQKRLFRAIEEDAKSYEAVLKAFHLPKDTEKEHLIRSKAIRQAYRKATITPQLVCQQSIELLEYSNTLILKGNPNALSDVGVAAFLADTAVKGGLLNIGINLGPVRDKSFREKMHSLIGKLEKRRNQLMGKIGKTLGRTLPV